MNVLIACEYSGTVREAFKKQGHYALSCDFLDTDVPGNHYKGDVKNVIGHGWDLMICHPPCTYLTVSGLHWNKRNPKRAAKTEEALEFIQYLLEAPIPRIALENPIGCISTRIQPPDQIIQPYNFGNDASKSTCLWLKALPKLENTIYVPPRIVIDANGKEQKRWANQTDSGQNRLGPSPDRWKLRSTTYQGIADAMALQWNF